MVSIDKIKEYIIDIPDYPKKGVIFRDITPLFSNYEIINSIIDEFAEFAKLLNIDVIVGAESRGFLFGVPLSLKIKKPFVLVRKPNKLPRETYSVSYNLEYGSSSIEIHKGDIKPGQRVLIIDDLLATGGTVEAIEKLVKMSDGVVAGSAYLIELESLKGREKLSGSVFSILKY
ncbi:MAG: adenine phosphoribosyltransferase [Candidatus Ureaplasma intestinipullorum]|uniref:Adenine phosphoribosyltransferase n=1 Tax=Candidatus Ureaplasma intestinipullorum TaxID=2838770 RepID=A0A9E2NW08_9BACT|nr:adenine phosphoribosyltransferase [Candidatus Ureaplasma intestinipullorum]